MLRKKLLKRGLPVLLLVVLLIPLLLIKPGQTKTLPYYSGDALEYRGQLVFATTNSGYLEIFKLNGNSIEVLVKEKKYNQTFNSYDDYSDVKLVIEHGNLYAYATSQYTVFKYNISDLTSLELVNKAKNNYWEWYNQVEKLGDSLALISSKGIKIINTNLEVINAYGFNDVDSYSVTSNGDKERILGIGESSLKIWNRTDALVSREIPLNFMAGDANHKAYLDSTANIIYAVDDYYAKKFDATTGKLLASFRHLDAAGYDMESSAGNSYVYFSNGFGVVKMDKAGFKVQDFVYTSMIGGPQGWAMGLKLVNTAKGDILVVFNGSNIVLLNNKLDKIASIKSTESAAKKPQENLYLSLNNNSATAGAEINLNGGGFWAHDRLQILLGNTELITIKADQNGRFYTTLTIPDVLKQKQDIKVNGLDSGLTYSISFEVK